MHTKRRILTLALCGALLMWGRAALAITVCWTGGADGGRHWTTGNGDCDCFPSGGPLDINCYPVASAAKEKGLIGPGGGVVIAHYENTFFESSERTGAVNAVLTNGKGTVIQTVALIGDLSRGHQPDTRRFLVSAEVVPSFSGRSLMSKTSWARSVLVVNVVTYDKASGVCSARQEVSLNFDADTLEFQDPDDVRHLRVLDGKTP